MSDVSWIAVLDSGAVELLHHSVAPKWPGFQVPLPEFVRYLRNREVVVAADGACTHASDLYLACACLRGVPQALRVLEREYLDPVLEPVGNEHSREDLRQSVLERLLACQEPRLPKLAEYSGRAALRTWLRVVAKRTHLNLVRKKVPTPLQDTAELSERFLIPAGCDPELDYMRLRYASRFKLAFRAALGRLEARDRLLLRLRIVEGATGKDIAALFGVTRVTIVRWMANLRRELFTQTRAQLEKDLQLSRREFESVVRLVQGALDISLSLLEAEEQ